MDASKSTRVVLVAGATGLVGGYIVQALIEDTSVNKVHVLSRRHVAMRHPKLHVHVVDFKALPPLPAADELYLALGTTIKVAGSQSAFREVDFNANLSVALAAQQAGVRRIGLVSAVGADAQSGTFYNRVKGELEDAIRALGFVGLVIAQPSLLLDHRKGLNQPTRWGERIAIPIAKLLSPILPGIYQPVGARAVAQALVKTVHQTVGTVILASNTLIDIGRDESVSVRT